MQDEVFTAVDIDPSHTRNLCGKIRDAENGRARSYAASDEPSGEGSRCRVPQDDVALPVSIGVIRPHY